MINAPVGPLLALPWGFVLMTVIGILIMEVAGIIAWKAMWHEDDDNVDLDKQEFVFTLDE